jgi:L-asparagine transporter-like permease
VLLVGSSAAGGLAAASFAPDTAFAFLVNSSGCLILLIYAAVCLAAWRIAPAAESGDGRGRQAVALLTLCAIGGLVLAMGTDRQLAPSRSAT